MSQSMDTLELITHNANGTVTIVFKSLTEGAPRQHLTITEEEAALLRDALFIPMEGD